MMCGSGKNSFYGANLYPREYPGFFLDKGVFSSYIFTLGINHGLEKTNRHEETEIYGRRVWCSSVECQGTVGLWQRYVLFSFPLCTLFSVKSQFSFYLDSVTSCGLPVQLIRAMYPVQALGAHTAMKLGLGRPMVNLARSVSDWLTAAPNRKVPTTL